MPKLPTECRPFVQSSNAMHGQNINLPVSVCLCVCVYVCHTFCQLAYRSDSLTPRPLALTLTPRPHAPSLTPLLPLVLTVWW